MGRDSRDVLREFYADKLPAMQEVFQFYQYVAEFKDYGEAVEQYDDEELFQLIGHFSQTLGPNSLEYTDLLLYAIEKRRLERWDWPILDLTNSARLAGKHYRNIRAHPIYRIAMAQAMYAPELLGEEPGSESFKLMRVGILNQATDTLFPAVMRHRFDMEKLREVAWEYHPYFQILREEADAFTDDIRTGGARRDFYRRYYLVEAQLGVIEDNWDMWWQLAEEDPQDSVRDPLLTYLLRYFSYWEPNIERALELAELMIFHPLGEDRQKGRIGYVCGTVRRFRRDEETLTKYVDRVSEMLDQFEEEMGEEGFDLTPYRKRLNQFNENKSE